MTEPACEVVETEEGATLESQSLKIVVRNSVSASNSGFFSGEDVMSFGVP